MTKNKCSIAKSNPKTKRDGGVHGAGIRRPLRDNSKLFIFVVSLFLAPHSKTSERMSSSSTASSVSSRPIRCSAPRLTLAEEQAAEALTQLEQRDVAAAMRLSLASSWRGEEEVDFESKYEDEESEEEEEEEKKKTSSVMDEEEEWREDIQQVHIPLPRSRRPHQQPLPDATTPFELLQLFLPQDLMEEFVRHTNAAAPRDWKPISTSELFAFIGAHVFMGIDRLPALEMYWSEDFGHSLLANVFSRDRFKTLQRYFRVVEDDEEASERDPMPRVRALADKLNEIFRKHYTPSVNLTIDETIVAFKGRARMKQYLPFKPHKWGYKIYGLANEGYLLSFEIYEGKAEEKSEFGATHDMCLRLIAGYEDKNHVLFTDSWFTSPTLMASLKERNIRLCGSVRRNRKGLPKISDTDIKSLKRGEWLQRQKRDTSLALWKDQKVVWILYNHCSPTEVTSLQRYNDFGTKVSLGCPRCIHDYFYFARAVDVLNQLHYGYLVGRKSRHCWPRLAWWLLDACIINAYKLWSLRQTAPRQLEFRILLMKELFSQFHSHRRAVQAAAHPPTDICMAKDHYAEHTEEIRDCIVCSRQPKNRVRTHVICHACKVHLCLGSCFSFHHR